MVRWHAAPGRNNSLRFFLKESFFPPRGPARAHAAGQGPDPRQTHTGHVFRRLTFKKGILSKLRVSVTHDTQKRKWTRRLAVACKVRRRLTVIAKLKPQIDHHRRTETPDSSSSFAFCSFRSVLLRRPFRSVPVGCACVPVPKY